MIIRQSLNITSRASGIFIVQPGWCSLPKKFLSSCSSGITDWRLRLIFQISTCVLQISGKEVEFAFCLKALLFSPCCISCSHLQAGRCSVLHNDCSPSSCTKPQIITSWIYINWKRQKAASFLPFFLYFWVFFFPLGKVSSLRFVENRCDSTLMHSDFIAYWNICITLNLENKLKLLMDFE